MGRGVGLSIGGVSPCNLFRSDTTTQAALALSVGLVFCLYAANFWDEGVTLQSISSHPGVFLLIVGASRLSGYLLPGHRDA